MTTITPTSAPDFFGASADYAAHPRARNSDQRSDHQRGALLASNWISAD